MDQQGFAAKLEQIEKRDLLRQAIERIGINAVSVRLDTTASVVHLWMDGQVAIPDRALIQLVNLLGSLSIHPRPPAKIARAGDAT